MRFALVGERLQAGRALPGRGAWICAGDDDCLRRAASPARLRRAFRRDVPHGAADDLIAALEPVGHGVSPPAPPRGARPPGGAPGATRYRCTTSGGSWG
ncbi:MAG: DUF448 domain-containing protein, partial [bacterium]|nr:DUF448 domain-containing protein [bacterium]